MRTARDERASALVVALVMLSAVGTVALALSYFADASLRQTSRATRPEREAVYAADGALDLGIQVLRRDTLAGAVGAPTCGDPAALLRLATLPAAPPQPAADTWCRPEPGSGVAGADRVVVLEARVDDVARLRGRVRFPVGGGVPVVESWAATGV